MMYFGSSMKRIVVRKCIKNYIKMQNIMILPLFLETSKKINDHTYKSGNDFLYPKFEYIRLICFLYNLLFVFTWIVMKTYD